jgi:translation initiation factor 4E
MNNEMEFDITKVEPIRFHFQINDEEVFDDEKSDASNATNTEKKQPHPLTDRWTLWAHLPHDTDWSIQSYKKIFTVTTVEEAIAITETLPEALVKNCMLFIMREGIKPVWEDPQNRNGGCFSYKINNKSVYEVWKDMSYVLMGETISDDAHFSSCVTGITISPKKNFCIIKIWLRDCKNQNPNIVSNDIKGITPYGCLFKKHTPEY